MTSSSIHSILQQLRGYVNRNGKNIREIVNIDEIFNVNYIAISVVYNKKSKNVN